MSKTSAKQCNIRSSHTGGNWWIERITLSSNRESKFSWSAKIMSQINFRVLTAAIIENPTKHYSHTNSKWQACPFCKCHSMRWSRPGIRWPLGRGFEPILERSIEEQWECNWRSTDLFRTTFRGWFSGKKLNIEWCAETDCQLYFTRVLHVPQSF
jgi:hypothetical protein